ncbi:MAG: hypothetical protein ACE5IR_13280 [bacterium]
MNFLNIPTQWHGYRNSDVIINAQTMKSVSGGGHWGGGMWISTRDMARFGYLFLRRGKWQDQGHFFRLLGGCDHAAHRRGTYVRLHIEQAG